MRYFILTLLLFTSLPVSLGNASAQQAFVPARGALISNIVIEGFALKNKNQFVKLFKPYRNKYLTSADMDEILQKIQDIYEKEGYQQLVSITYRVDKRRLVFTALMTS